MTHDPLRDNPNPHRLYRNKQRAMVGGVIAGFSDYTGVEVTWLRLGAIALALFGMIGFVLIGYIICWIIIPARPIDVRRPESNEEDEFLRGVARKPSETFSNLRYAFRDLEDRLQTIERTVTSEEWRLRREFDDLERKGR